MKVSDYIVKFLISKGITDTFGYPGGMVTHLMESFDKYSEQIYAHLNYHEQASAFCACGYAQLKHIPGVGYATSGPGATNLITGIANAFFDSIPCIFITGQVNTYESKCDLHVRQKGFQETNIVDIVSSITKYAIKIENPNSIKYELEKAFNICMEARPGPVVLDIPMDIFRSQININEINSYNHTKIDDNDGYQYYANLILDELIISRKPVILLGNGVNISNTSTLIRDLIEKLRIPVVTSMIAVDTIESSSPYSFGFIGAYGHRAANFIVSQSDLIVSLGSRLDCRQTGSDTNQFAPNSKIIRVDIDSEEMSNRIQDNEIQIKANLHELMPHLLRSPLLKTFHQNNNWLQRCQTIKSELKNIDNQYVTKIIENLSSIIPNNFTITTDVGQNQVWIAQYFQIKKNQRILFSGGHGAMGYSLPAAIGAYYATQKPVICFSGDGGLQMNIQELQFIARENIPIKIVLLNNNSLGMIRHFQEMYFNSNYVQTQSEKGYLTPNFEKIVNAYNLDYTLVDDEDDIKNCEHLLEDSNPHFIEIKLDNNTYVFPKLAVNQPIYHQEPPIDNELLRQLLEYINK